MSARTPYQTIASDLRMAWVLAVKDVRNRYASSFAGVAWTIGVPLLYAGISAVVFSVLMAGRMGERYSEIPFVIFYFVPFSLWTLFSDTVIRSTGILKDYRYLINKVAFPYWVLPLVPLASATINQMVLLSIAAIFMFMHDVPLSGHAYVYILVWICTLLLTIGVSYAAAALSVYIPDIAQLVPVLVNVGFWLTPILYPATLVENGGALWVRNLIMHFNPFYYLVETSRFAVFGSAMVPISGYTFTAVFCVLVFIFGGLIFRKLRRGFADVL